MTLPVVWLPEADAELKEAMARYESIRPELAQRFAEAVADTIEKVAVAPLHYAVVEKGRRRAGVRRFPYGIFFVDEPVRGGYGTEMVGAGRFERPAPLLPRHG